MPFHPFRMNLFNLCLFKFRSVEIRIHAVLSVAEEDVFCRNSLLLQFVVCMFDCFHVIFTNDLLL